jgi:hypothetical protein
MMALFSLSPWNAAIAEEKKIVFIGTVEIGMNFTHGLPDGMTLKLVPEEDGWKIGIFDEKHTRCTSKEYNCNDLASASESLFGANMRNIYGWQFMQNASHSPKNITGTSFNLERVFAYADRKTLARIMASDDCVEHTRPHCENVAELPVRKGVLSISSYKPYVSKDGKNLTIQNMQFTVTIYPPSQVKDQLNQ